ncbi:hypothetical protein BSZ39_05560 [Bowdeniella nasicola]|uniref:YdbS-like PH domain-containing protein n=1 Tax=Bowdeniella nasicola TaxID=208480 RepID=A0A1Q5Q303_9ACTO|nr:PH domain-containing protein [Bowdeniella nasicola]OKL54187.1 hypothetical protein BSZ39_05560 [Bowdeniella nasicola]
MSSQGAVFHPAGIKFTPVSLSLIKARLIVAAIFFLPPLVAFVTLGIWVSSWFYISAAIMVLLLAWLGWLIPRQVRALGYAETDQEFIIRRGIMFRSLTIVPYGRMQYVDVSEGPLARACGIASIKLHTASASTDASLDGLPPKEAERLRDLLTARGEAQLAGL